MKRKRSIPGVRLLLCALLAAAALVGVTQRAEAAYTEEAESIEISKKTLHHPGSCSEKEWLSWELDPVKGDYKRFEVSGVKGCNGSAGEQNPMHRAALQFKNSGTSDGELIISYKAASYTYAGGHLSAWLFPKNTEGQYLDDPVNKTGVSSALALDSGWVTGQLSGWDSKYDDPNGEPLTCIAKLKAGETASFVIEVYCNSGWSTPAYGRIDIYSVTFIPDGKAVNATFTAPIEDKDLASYTVSYTDENGNTVLDMGKDSDSVTKAIMSSTDVTLKAPGTVGEGDNKHIFRDWYDKKNNKTLSTSPTATLRILEDAEITARYVDQYSTPVFWAGNQTFTNLTDAVAYARINMIATVFLVKSGAINEACTIPQGITLLLPWMKDSGEYRDLVADKRQEKPEASNPSFDVDSNRDERDWMLGQTSSVKLTMNPNASITVENGGAIEVGGMYVVNQGVPNSCFAPAYRFGHIFMGDNARITVQNGGKLYAWGYINGNGTVTAESGAEVWELFQIADWCGGGATETFYNNKSDWKIFPFSQYYIQNIEANLTLKAGAVEKVKTAGKVGADTVVGKVGGVFTTDTVLVGDEKSGGLFQIKTGAEFRRKYHPKTDRIEYTVAHGHVSLSSIVMTLSGYAINSAEYVLPINGNITVNIESGAVLIVTKDVSLLPGVEVNIKAGGELAMWESAHLYIYDREQWVKENYCYQGKHFQSVAFSPSVSGNNKHPLKIRSDEDLKDVKIDINGKLYGCGNVYTTAGGANICSSDGTGTFVAAKNTVTSFTEGVLKQKVYGNNPTTIPITLAKLKNGDGSYTETQASTDSKTPKQYYYHTDTGTWSTGWVVYATLDYNYDGAPDATTIPSTSELPTPPTRTGYTFTGWNTAEDGSGDKYNAGGRFNTNITLYAQWEAKTYTLMLSNNFSNYNKNSADAKAFTLTTASKKTIQQIEPGSLRFTVAYDDVIILPDGKILNGYSGSTFEGWKPMWCVDMETRPAGAEITINEDLVWTDDPNKSTIYLYAQWSRKDYTVTAESRSFENQSDWTRVSLDYTVGTSPIADVSLDGMGKYELDEDSVTVTAPEKEGFTFQGWYCGYKWDAPKYRFSTELKASISLRDLADKSQMLKSGRDSNGDIRLVAVYTPKPETTPLTLKLDKAPTGVEVSWGGVSQTGTNTWRVPVGAEVTIKVPDSTGFQYWTNANDKVMSKEKIYKFTMVTNTTLTAVTNDSTSTTFVIFQSADERLLKADTLNNIKEFPAAPYRVGHKSAGWKVGNKTVSTAQDITVDMATNGIITVTAAYEEITEAEYTVTATQVVDGVTIEGSGEKSYKLGEIATFTADPTANNKDFRFWASNANGTNILSFSRTYSFRVTKDIEIYAIYGGENKPEVQPVVRVDNVLKSGSPQSLTFMIGASIPSDYELVEMGALYAKGLNDGVSADEQLRVEKVDNSTVRKAVSRLKHESNLTDYSYALGFNMTDKLNDTIYLRGYVAVKKTDNNTIYYYYSGVRLASYDKPGGTNS